MAVGHIRVRRWGLHKDRWPVREILRISHARKVLHSARHRYEDLCRSAGIPNVVPDALTGRSGADVGGRPSKCGRILTSIAALLLLLTSAGPAAAQAMENCEPLADFASAVFKPPTEIDNKWFPLAPGKQFTFVGEANIGDEEPRILPHIVVFTVTDMTKVISRVETLVIWERDFAIDEEGEQFLVEEELAFFAQDEDGNVWSLGEYPEEFEDGEFVGAPSTWINGVDDAQGGILVLRRQRRGTEYLQALVPSIEVFDCGLVHRQGRIRVRDRVFQNVVVVRERDAFDTDGAIQQKYYAHGLGLVKVDALNDPEGETLELVKRVTLGPEGLATTRENVRRLESNAYNSEDHRVRNVYGQTDPAQQLAR